MKIVFALILFSHQYVGIVGIKIGEYEKYHQCIEQGEKLSNNYNITFECILVNK